MIKSDPSVIARKAVGLTKQSPASSLRARKGRGNPTSLKKMYCFFALLIAMTTLWSYNLSAAEKNVVPRFVSLRPKEVNARVGPGPEYPVKWIFIKAGLPVEVTAEFDTWRRIRDVDGDEGWVHQNMLCSKRHAIINCPETLVYSGEDEKSSPVVRVQKGVAVDLVKCRGDWCKVQVGEYKGWIKRGTLWGVYPSENVG
jgi:SH3-like domain-containing protein